MPPPFFPPIGNSNTHQIAHMSMEAERPRYDHDYNYPPSMSGSMVSDDDGRSFYQTHPQSIPTASASDDGGQSQYSSRSLENVSSLHNHPHTRFKPPEDSCHLHHQAPAHAMSMIPENSNNLHTRDRYQFPSPLISPVATRRLAIERDGYVSSASISPYGSQGRVIGHHEDRCNSRTSAYTGHCTSPHIFQADAANESRSLEQPCDVSQGQSEEAPILLVNSANPYQENLANDFLEQFNQNSDTAANLDVICALLKLSPEMWEHFCVLRTSQETQLKLRPHLRQLFEVPPASLWKLLVTIKTMYLEVLPHDFVERLRSLPLPVSQSQSRSSSISLPFESPLQFPRSNGPAALHPSGVPSPGRGSGMSSPMLEDSFSQTPCPTPVSVIHSRRSSGSRHPTGKGRAPPGHKYCCPHPNCRCRKPFTNWGNFANHMKLAHAKNNLNRPESYLQPDSASPQDNGEELAPAVTADTSDQLGYERDLSEDISGVGGAMNTASQGNFNEEIGYGMGSSGPEEFHRMGIHAYSVSNDVTSSFPFHDNYGHAPLRRQLVPVHASFMSPNTPTEGSQTNDGGMQFCSPQPNMFSSYRGIQ